MGPRQAAWSEYVKSAVRRAAPRSVPELAEAAQIGKTTLYRWLNGDWEDDPSPSQVKRFAEVIGLKPIEAFTVLWLGDEGPRVAPAPADDPDVVEILKALRNPRTPEAERYLLKETLRSLAARSQQSSHRPRKAG